MNSLALVATVVVWLDGWFHLLTLPDSLKRLSPDWILANGLFDAAGLPAWTHRVMGVFLIAGASYMAYVLLSGAPATLVSRIWLTVVTPITLFMIGAAAVYKLRE